MVHLAQGLAGCGRWPPGILAPIKNARGILVVVKNATYAAGLTAVLEVEVFITPGLKHLIIKGINAIASPLDGAVEVLGILQKWVVGSEVGATAKPPHRASLEIAVVEVNRGDVGIARVQHHRGASGKPAVALGFWALAED